MNIIIKKLTPELTEDYLHFFDVTPHSERPDSDDCKCYCVWWCNDNQTNEVFDKYLSTKEKRREYARNKIKENKIQGYLAYCDDKVVGWCNTNTKIDCYTSFCWCNFMGAVPKDDTASKTKSILCFAIAPEMQGKGIATMLLQRVCTDAKADHFEVVEGYPNKNFESKAKDFMGPLKMYEKSGFTKSYETDEKFVMQKKLS